MSSPSTTHKKPQLLWATPADTPTAIPIAASTAIEAGAPRPDGRPGWAAEDGAATRAWGPGRVLGRSRRRSFSSPQVRAARARPVRSSSSSGVSLPAWKFALRSDRTASRSASEALTSVEFPGPGVHQAAALPSRAALPCAVVSGFRIRCLAADGQPVTGGGAGRPCRSSANTFSSCWVAAPGPPRAPGDRSGTGHDAWRRGRGRGREHGLRTERRVLQMACTVRQRGRMPGRVDRRPVRIWSGPGQSLRIAKISWSWPGWPRGRPRPTRRRRRRTGPGRMTCR